MFEDFYFYVIKSQYKTTKNGKRYILMNVINESGFFDLRLFRILLLKFKIEVVYKSVNAFN